MDKLKTGILTVSDRASRGEYEDLSGAEIRKVLSEYLLNEMDMVSEMVPDDMETIKKSIMRMADVRECCLILTTGGTGPAARDVTPEATEQACHRLLPGFGELMRSESLKYVPTAILSRQTAGIRNRTLVVNLPGKPKSIRECLQAVFPAIPYCIDLIGGPYLEANEKNIRIFRPKQSRV